jgi:hypothetical protein
MKYRLLLFSLLAAGRLVAREPLEFVGYMTSANHRGFVLYDGADRLMSPWIDLGQSWHGYALLSFERGSEKLTVTRGADVSVLTLRGSKVRAPSVLRVTKGSYRVLDHAVVYGPDAEIRIGGRLISSPTGVMVSDLDQKIVVGDFTVETAGGTTQFEEGVLQVTGAGTTVTAKSASFTSKPVSPAPPVPPGTVQP